MIFQNDSTNELRKKQISENIAFVSDCISVEDALGQLVEECAELIQAAHKLNRAYAGTVDMTESEALMNLAEECADVLNCLDVVEALSLIDIDCVSRVRAHKAGRWCRRISSGDWGAE